MYNIISIWTAYLIILSTYYKKAWFYNNYNYILVTIIIYTEPSLDFWQIKY